MRRISLFLAIAAIVLCAVVGYTYKLRIDAARGRKASATPPIPLGQEARADRGWVWNKSDPQTNRPIVRLTAKSFSATNAPSTVEVHDLALKLYKNDASSYTYIRSGLALLDERSGLLKSQGPVSIIMNVPAGKDGADPAQTAKLVHVETSGISYETNTGKAETDQPASFKFTEGDGQAVGVAYDPATGALHLKSHVSLDWIGHGPAANKMHIEAGDLVYKEHEQKIYLSPWSKMERQTTAIQAANSVVTLVDGALHQIDSEHASGTDTREDKKTSYSADRMTALFDDNGALVNIVGTGNAQVVSTQQSSRTTVKGNRADLRFAVGTRVVNGEQVNESDLHLVMADGHTIAESEPLPQAGVPLAESHILRSEHIDLEMKPGGKDVQEIRTPVPSQLVFLPNRPDQSHRTLDASRLRILYGEGSYIQSFTAWNAATHTDKPQSLAKAGKPSPPALTWSDQLIAKFATGSNQVSFIEQDGNFRYQEGTRKASAKKAVLEQTINRITLLDSARVADDTGSAVADKIVMNQANGDMDASGHVLSTRKPDPNQKPGTSMLDSTKTMQARADQMETRNDNSDIFYQGHVVMWQGANRISASAITISRDDQTLHASGNVVSELVDDKQGTAKPVFTTVNAPDLQYRDDTRVALYTGGVKLVRDKMTVTSKQLQAFLSPKTASKDDNSSLDHAIADGNVVIVSTVVPGRTRTGSAEHCDYDTKLDKVVLTGGSPQIQDSYKGFTKGRQLTYFSDDDRLIVEGEKGHLAYTQMVKK